MEGNFASSNTYRVVPSVVRPSGGARPQRYGRSPGFVMFERERFQPTLESISCYFNYSFLVLRDRESEFGHVL